MSAADAASAAERQIARVALAGERDYVAAALAFIRELVALVGLGASDIAGLERAAAAVCVNVIENGFEPGQPANAVVEPDQLLSSAERLSPRSSPSPSPRSA